jgi:hypothetical protein
MFFEEVKRSAASHDEKKHRRSPPLQRQADTCTPDRVPTRRGIYEKMRVRHSAGKRTYEQ